MQFFEIYLHFSSTSLLLNQPNLTITVYQTTFFLIVFIYFFLGSSISPPFLCRLLFMRLRIRIGWGCAPNFVLRRIIWIVFFRKTCKIVCNIWNKIRWNMFEKSKAKTWSWKLNCKCIRIDKSIGYNLWLFRFKTFLNILLIN